MKNKEERKGGRGCHQGWRVVPLSIPYDHHALECSTPSACAPPRPLPAHSVAQWSNGKPPPPNSSDLLSHFPARNEKNAANNASGVVGFTVFILTATMQPIWRLVILRNPFSFLCRNNRLATSFGALCIVQWQIPPGISKSCHSKCVTMNALWQKLLCHKPPYSVVRTIRLQELESPPSG